MAAMIAPARAGEWGGSKFQSMPVRDAREQFGSRAGARWVGAVMVTALLWCNCALGAEPRVLLLRGWFGVFSTGLDKIAEELKAKGIKAEVAGHLYWSAAVTEILREQAAGATGPLVLVGHSQGANNVIDIARSLEAHKVPVTLLVTLAPYMQNPIPANVVRAINYYQDPGGDLAPDRCPARGKRGSRRCRRLPQSAGRRGTPAIIKKELHRAPHVTNDPGAKCAGAKG